MYSFKNDYSDGGHPLILKALSETSQTQEDGYGLDSYSEKAKEFILKKMNSAHSDIHFLVGGTLTNLVALSAFLRPHEAVISACTGHINVHETGAIEATGHKIITLESDDGKVKPHLVRALFESHDDEHMVKPRLVYLSQSTEMGTLYSLDEVRELKSLCEELDLFLYIDGARLGSALASEENDLTLEHLRDLCDAFYLGGTKNGALLGEALVINKDQLKRDFRHVLKQRGALLAKGRVLAVQFITLFENNLYTDLGKHSNDLSGKLQKGILDLGYSLKFHSSTNQIFPILPHGIIEALEENYAFYIWEESGEGMSVIRLICSWATEEIYVDQFLRDLKKITQKLKL